MLSKEALVAAILASALLPQARVFAATETVLYNFSGSDGAGPVGNLVRDSTGALYGVAPYGGSSNYGVIFKLTPSGSGWTQTILHTFSGGSDGAGPQGGLVMDSSGSLYGTAYSGGVNHTGTVFRLSPPAPGVSGWGFSVLYSFGTGKSGDAANPVAPLLIDGSGALYGTSQSGGGGCPSFTPFGCGAVFKLTPPAAGQVTWTESVLYAFTSGADGYQPLGGLIADKAGALYGTTSGGGSCAKPSIGCGVVFKLSRPTTGSAWSYATLYSFGGKPNGLAPQSRLVADSTGALYGTTAAGGGACPTNWKMPSGCGAVYKLTPPAAGKTAWTESIIRKFAGGTDGAAPYGSLVFGSDGSLYGTTRLGGATTAVRPTGWGTVFKLTPTSKTAKTWTGGPIYSFTGTSGGDPFAGLTPGAGGAFYGVASAGGSSTTGYSGVVFQLTP